jgi:hypothetical protein
MCGSRWVVGMVVVTSAALVCGGAAAQAPAATAAAGHRFVHIHEFPDLGFAWRRRPVTRGCPGSGPCGRLRCEAFLTPAGCRR